MSTFNWHFKDQEITDINQFPEDTFGFVYIIYNLNNAKKYIGKKQIRSVRKKKFGKRQLSKITDKRLKKYEIITSEMKGWKEYTGSSEELNADIAKGDKIHKEIIHLCKSKKELTYFETKELFCEGTIESDQFYNGNILSKFFPRDLKE